MRNFWLVIVIGFLSVVFTIDLFANETHIFFGKFDPKIKDLTQGRVAVQQDCIITGDYVSRTDVLVLGEVTTNRRGVVLSNVPDVFGAGGHEATISIDYPQGVGILEIVFVDHSAYPPAMGGTIRVNARAAGFGQGITTLEVNFGGQPEWREKFARQLFQPFFYGEAAGMESKIVLHAYGYDEYEIHRVSIYTSPGSIGVNTNFLDGAKGKKSKAMSASTDAEDMLLNRFLKDFRRK